MMPFTVLRSLLLFLFGWVILGVGVYFAYDLIQSYRHADDNVVVLRVPIEPPVDSAISDTELVEERLVDERQVGDRQEVVVARDRVNGWNRLGKLVAVIVCLGISVGGRLPLRLLMKSGGSSEAVSVEPKAPSPPTTLEVERPDGSRLHVEIFGNKSKPTLLLTHGWSLDSTAWRYMRASLDAHYRVVVWDLAGLGKSKGPKTNDYSLEKLANDLNAVLDHVAPEGPVILVGHSIGGMTAQTFCRLHRDKLGKSIKGIVLLHTTYTNPLATNMLAWIVKPLEPVVSLVNFVMIPLAPLVWISNWQSYFNGSAHWAARLESFTGKQSWEQLDHSAKMGAMAWPSVVARGNFGMMKFNEEQILPEVQVPVLVVSGTHDRLTVPSASQHISKLLPNDTSISDDGGHLGYWEHNEQISDAVLKFANRVFSQSAPRSIELNVI